MKTKKVAGTSFEIALSKYCGPNCIITPVSKDDEATRKRLGFRTAQNYLQANRAGFGVEGHPNQTIKGKFENHHTASKIHAQIGDAIFYGYQKISIYRNPLDFLISLYFFRRKRGQAPLPFREWYFQNMDSVLENRDIAPASGPYACDIILRYEALQTEILTVPGLAEGFLDTFRVLDAKRGYRDPSSRDARAFFAEHGLGDEIERLLRQAG
ncbi:MAG: hypothetical protein RIG84_11550 [Roseovarius sp.]